MALRQAKRAAFDVLQLSNAEASVEVCPQRGALVTDFTVGTQPVLFLDPATFADSTKSVRGGVPLLFPIAGPAPEGSRLSQHGFARTSAWTVVKAGDDQVALRLVSSPATREKFPYDFQLDFDLRLEGATLKLRWIVKNASAALAMPLQFGLHPYFFVPVEAKAAATVDTAATRAWNNLTRAFGPSTGSPAFGGGEIDVHLLDHAEPGTRLSRGAGLAPIRLRWSPSFQNLVLWTLPDKPFVCVEPWSSPSVAARAGAALPQLAPHGVETYTLDVSLG